MKVIITSGGTSEAIDQVRAITNHSTGRLGQQLTQYFLDRGDQVSLVTTKRAVQVSPHPHLETHFIENVADLESCLEKLVPEHEAIIHAMAVSDYTPVYMTDMAELLESKDLSQLLTKENTETKISSAADHQVLFLKKTPKIISQIKKWNPQIQLIGFKLLVDVRPSELIEVARASLRKNQADLILANDLLEVTADQHRAYLVFEDHEEIVESREQIAQALYQVLHSVH